MNIDANCGKDGAIYTDKYYWYPKGTATTYKENVDTPAGCFYACDRVNYQNDEQQLNGVSDIGLEKLTIETNKRYEFKKGDRVRSVTDERFWEILSVVVDDDGKAKELSLRPPRISVLTLIRTESDRND